MIKKRFFIILGCFILILTSVAFLTAWYFYITPQVTTPKGKNYELRKGTSKRTFVAELVQEGIITQPSLLTLYAYLHPRTQLKTGEYYFAKGSTLVSIWNQVTTGSGFAYHQFKIIPGWTFGQLREALDKDPLLKHLTPTLDNKQIMNLLGQVDLHPEGEFFPETYYYTKDTPDLVILKRAFDLMQNRLNDAWEQHDKDLPYRNAYQALIVASMIEKEAYLSSERPVIAGVIVNRLRKDMLLQIDPTVVYGIGSRYDGKIYKTDLVEDTPYNTYVRKGLPPTPIAIPSFASIEAAMHPKQHEYLYFVAKGNGAHQFSATLLAHNAAVATAASNRRSGYFNEFKVRQYLNQLLTVTLQHG